MNEMTSLASKDIVNSIANERAKVIVDFFRTAAKERRKVYLKEFQKEAQRVLHISHEDALELAYQMDFEDGLMAVPGSLFCSPPRNKPLNTTNPFSEPSMRTLYYDTLYHYAKDQPTKYDDKTEDQSYDNTHQNSDTIEDLPTSEALQANGRSRHCRGNNNGDDDDCKKEFSQPVYALAADLWKISDTYAMDVADFTRIAYQHDLRRSDIHGLLKLFNFVGGLVVNPKEKWFDESGSMHKSYLDYLAQVFSEGPTTSITEFADQDISTDNFVSPKVSSSLDASELPDWARPSLKSKKQVDLEAPKSAPSAMERRHRSQYRRMHRNSAPSSARQRAQLNHLHVVTNNDVNNTNDQTLPVESCSSPSSPETPDWGSSFVWRRRLSR